MRFASVCVAAIAAVASGIAVAEEGRIPLYEPTIITVSGHYVVTNDFEAVSGPAIRIEALDVTIDLNGHTVRGDVVTSPAAGEHRLSLRNGRIIGMLAKSFTAGAQAGDVEPRSAVDWMKVRLTSLTGLGGGISFDPCYSFELSDSTIEGGVFVIGNTASAYARIVDSTMGSIWIGDLRHGVIRGNTIGSDVTLANGDLGSSDNLVEDNMVGGHIGLSGGAPGSVRNVIRGNQAGAIDVNTDDNQVVGNSLRKGTITVNGSKNLVDGNAVQGAGVGLILNGDNNVYRNNVLHNNAGGAVQDNGTGNVDAGGNVN
jgi:hypothetical protein